MSAAIKPIDAWPKEYKPQARDIVDSHGDPEHILVFPDPSKSAKDWPVITFQNRDMRDFQFVQALKIYRIGRCSPWQSSYKTDRTG